MVQVFDDSRTISFHDNLFVKRARIVKTHAHADQLAMLISCRRNAGRARTAVGAIELDRSSAVRNHTKTSKGSDGYVCVAYL